MKISFSPRLRRSERNGGSGGSRATRWMPAARRAIWFCLNSTIGQNSVGYISSAFRLLIIEGRNVSATVAQFTVSEKILLAAYSLDKKGQTSFTAEDLVVTSWKQFGKT